PAASEHFIEGAVVVVGAKVHLVTGQVPFLALFSEELVIGRQAAPTTGRRKSTDVAAILDTGVAGAFVFQLELQVKVGRLATLPDDERGAGRIVGLGFADNGTVFDPPDSRCSIPIL